MVRDMEHSLQIAAADSEQHLKAAEEKLQTISPFAILNRGYSMIFGPDGKTPLTDPAQAPAGELLTARLAKGTIKLRSEGKK